MKSSPQPDILLFISLKAPAGVPIGTMTSSGAVSAGSPCLGGYVGKILLYSSSKCSNV